MLILIEGIALSFFLLITCVIGIANGPAGLAVLYEQDVQDRVVALGLTTKKKLRRSFLLTCLALYLPVLILTPVMVYGINGAAGFWQGFGQMTAILLIMGLFDRLFIDWYWVEHTKAWIIPGTEDLRPYIPVRAKIGKWAATLVLHPILAAAIAGIVTLLS